MRLYKCRQSELHTTKVVIVMIFIKVGLLLFKYENTKANNPMDRDYEVILTVNLKDKQG